MVRAPGQGCPYDFQESRPPGRHFKPHRRYSNRNAPSDLRAGRLDVSTAALSRIEHVATKYYLAIADRLPHESNWSILFPAFPGVTSVAEAFADVMRQAKDALASVV